MRRARSSDAVGHDGVEQGAVEQREDRERALVQPPYITHASMWWHAWRSGSVTSSDAAYRHQLLCVCITAIAYPVKMSAYSQ